MNTRHKRSRRVTPAGKNALVRSAGFAEEETREPASPVCYLKEFEDLILGEAEKSMTMRIQRADTSEGVVNVSAGGRMHGQDIADERGHGD